MYIMRAMFTKFSTLSRSIGTFQISIVIINQKDKIPGFGGQSMVKEDCWEFGQ